MGLDLQPTNGLVSTPRLDNVHQAKELERDAGVTGLRVLFVLRALSPATRQRGTRHR
jgi:hypothetical protein